MSQRWLSLFCTSAVILVVASDLNARGPMVSELGNKHNLSAQNTGVFYRAKENVAGSNPGGQQICIFCHTPHNSQPQGPLWNRKDTKETFARYSSNTLKIGTIAASQYRADGDAQGQPNGSSRLCLSCHDGVTGLGDVIRSGQLGQIQMEGGNSISTNRVTSFNPQTNKMKVGHHPVSFVYATGFNYKTQNGTIIGLNGASFTIPKQSTQPLMAEKVKLQDSKRDGRGWMQCTTCHDPHQNMGNEATTYPAPDIDRKITPFWVYSGASAVAGHDAVCNSCHKDTVEPLDVMDAPYNVGGSNPPWPRSTP